MPRTGAGQAWGAPSASAATSSARRGAAASVASAATRRLAFDVAGDAGDHPRHVLGARGDVLVHEALQIGELAPDLGGRVQALAELVRDDDQGRRHGREPVDLGAGALEALLDVAAEVAEEIREPERDAVDHRHLACELERSELELALDAAPLRAALAAMARDARGVVVVPDARGGDVQGARREGERERLGVPALARARAADHEGEAHGAASGTRAPGKRKPRRPRGTRATP